MPARPAALWGVFSANIHRRRMTKGQRAMVVAKIYPEPEKGGRGKKASLKEEFGFGAAHLSRARTVIRYAGDLADGVLAGNPSLDVAYKVAR